MIMVLDEEVIIGGAYKSKEHDVFLEAWGNWDGYAHQSRWQPEMSSATLHHMTITLYKKGLKKSIQRIISDFPKVKKRKTA